MKEELRNICRLLIDKRFKVQSTVITCLPSCIDKNHTKQFEDITAGEFLTQRLREIGLY